MGKADLSIEELVAQAMALRHAAQVEVGAPAVSVRPASANAYEEAAAVLGWFDPDTLLPSTSEAPGSGLDALLVAVTHVVDDRGADALSISSNRRIEVLRHLRETGNVDRALRANQASERDQLHKLIRILVTGGSVDIEKQSLPDLHSLALVCDWLRQAGFEQLPDHTRLHDRIDLLALLEPLELLAGPDFVGRKAELAALRDFVAHEPAPGVTPRRGRSRESASAGPDHRMLVLYGPGGIGKSTLVAKCLLELGGRDTPDETRVPFAYLDFDRPSVEATNQCLILLIEILAQLGIEFPDAKASCNRIREDWALVLQVPRGKRHFSLPRAVDELVTLLKQLGLDERGFVLVLDTFEVVQYLGSEEVAAVLRLVDLLVKKMPTARVVVAGRAGITRTYATQREVAALDLDSARELLMKLGVEDRKLADRIAHRYGGDPVSLKLAASDPEAHRPLSNLFSRAADWFLQLDAAVIQRRLYDRVLGHVHNEQVRRLAGSGLVLRRITPEIVLRVLSKPCELDVVTLDQAREVCDELRRETSLVSVDTDGALVHRPELRRVMLPLLEADQPVMSQALHRAAVAYYAARPPVVRERAEEIYHRLKCGEDIGLVDSRWMDGVQPDLAAAIDELDGRRRAFLASRLGLTIDAMATNAARLEDYEELTARKVRAMLDDDRPRDALTALGTRMERSPRSPLTTLTAEALFALGQLDQALALLGETADGALVAGVTDQTYRLTRMQAELVISAGAWDAVEPVLHRLEQVDFLSSDPLVGLGCTALGAVLSLRVSDTRAAAFRKRALARMDDLGDVVLQDDPSLVRLVGTLLDGGKPRDVGRMARVVTLAGMPRHLEGPVRVVAAELARVDLDASARDGEQPGMLARRSRLPQSRSLTAAWSEFLLVADEVAVRSAVRDVLDWPDVDVAGLVAALARLMGTDPRLRRETERHVEPEAEDVITRVSLPPDAHRMLTEALSSVFTPESLRWFLRIRLHQSLDALVPGDKLDFDDSVRQLVNVLEDRGLLLELVARAREVAPGDLRLLRAADAVGLETPLTGALEEIVEQVEAGGQTIEPWLHVLGDAEAQTCTIHRGEEIVGGGFLVGADLVLTAEAVVARIGNARAHCRFDAKASRHGDLVTPGIWYDALEVVASRSDRDAGGGWGLLRVAGSPGVQPIGGDAVESSTGTLRGWVDLSRPDTEPPPGHPLILSPGSKASVRLLMSRAQPPSDGSDFFTIDLPSHDVWVGAAIYSWDMVPVGLLCVADDTEGVNAGVVVMLDAVLADLARLGLDHLVRTLLA